MYEFMVNFLHSLCLICLQFSPKFALQCYSRYFCTHHPSVSFCFFFSLPFALMELFLDTCFIVTANCVGTAMYYSYKYYKLLSITARCFLPCLCTLRLTAYVKDGELPRKPARYPRAFSSFIFFIHYPHLSFILRFIFFTCMRENGKIYEKEKKTTQKDKNMSDTFSESVST